MHNHPSSEHKPRSVPTRLLVGLSTLIVATGVTTAWITWHSQETPRSPTVTTEQRQPVPTQPIAQTLQIYWLQDNDGHINMMPQTLQIEASTPSGYIEQALKNLLAGPTASTVQSGAASTIPANTKLLSLAIKDDPGYAGIYINLSPEFTHGGGSTAMVGRLAQVLYTATSLDPQAKVWLSVNGEPLTQLGGEGVMISQPITRKAFADNFQL